jgi:hypothetical protein
MRLVVVSDTHGLHNRIESLPAGDILVHAGDFMNSGYDTEHLVLRSLAWRTIVQAPCGMRRNHDLYFQNSPQQACSLLTNALYLEKAGVTIGNVSFWGSPYTPEFLNWAFMYPRGSAGKRYWHQIPTTLTCSSPTDHHSGFSTKPRRETRISDARNYSKRWKRRSPKYIYSAISTEEQELSRSTSPPPS